MYQGIYRLSTRSLRDHDLYNPYDYDLDGSLLNDDEFDDDSSMERSKNDETVVKQKMCHIATQKNRYRLLQKKSNNHDCMIHMK